MSKLWDFYDGEPWLDNPRLLILNPKRNRKGYPMRSSYRRRQRRPYRMNARRRTRRSYRMNPARHQRRPYRRNLFVNPRHRRRPYRRNPGIGLTGEVLGFPIKQVLTAGAAVVGAPYLESEILALLPVSFAAQTSGRWTAKVGAAVGTGYLAKLALGNEAARMAYIVLGANLVADAVAEFMPSLTPGGQPATTSFYTPRGMGFYPNAFGAGPARMVAPYTGVSGQARIPMTAAQDPFTPVF